MEKLASRFLFQALEQKLPKLNIFHLVFLASLSVYDYGLESTAFCSLELAIRQLVFGHCQPCFTLWFLMCIEICTS